MFDEPAETAVINPAVVTETADVLEEAQGVAPATGVPASVVEAPTHKLAEVGVMVGLGLTVIVSTIEVQPPLV